MYLMTIFMRLCVQCHSPNALHEAGSSDDRTPTGVHEGLSCTACHDVHSNDARKSCGKCHPAISNCKLDVTMMNTLHTWIRKVHTIFIVSAVLIVTKRKISKENY